MNEAEQKAFVKAYDVHVNHMPADFVADFVKRHVNGEKIPYQEGYSSIMDALGVWHEAVRFQLMQNKQGAKNV